MISRKQMQLLVNYNESHWWRLIMKIQGKEISNEMNDFINNFSLNFYRGLRQDLEEPTIK